MDKSIDLESVSMLLIAYSGEARTLAYSALQCAKDKNYAEAKRLMSESVVASTRAHQAQVDLLVGEANGKKNEVNVLLIHAQDHLMTSLLAQELIKEIICLHEIKQDKEEI